MVENKQKVLTFPTPSKNGLAQKLSWVTMWLCHHLTGEIRSWRPLLNTSFGLLNNRKITNKLKKSVEGKPECTGSGALALWGEPVEKTPLGRTWQVLLMLTSIRCWRDGPRCSWQCMQISNIPWTWVAYLVKYSMSGWHAQQSQYV